MSNFFSPEDVSEIYSLLKMQGIHVWLMGGWGVDALFEEQSRPHKDLDLLVLLSDLCSFEQFITNLGFKRKYVWDEENRWIELSGQQYPTAYVTADGKGRELDIHVIDLDEEGNILQMSDVPWPLTPLSLQGRGKVGGVVVDCVSLPSQIDMHQGYKLSPTHQQDLNLLLAYQRAASS